MSTCRSCGADITWAVTENGKRVPLDTTRKVIAISILGPEFDVDMPDGYQTGVQFVSGYESHFATCPNADEHRR